MATTEPARHQLYRRLTETIGPDEADTLMELLPPTSWADVATRNDVRSLGDEMNARFIHWAAETDRRFTELRSEMNDRFAEIEGRFGAIDGRFGTLDGRFEAIDARFAALDGRFEAIDARFAALDGRFEAIDARFAASEDRDAHLAEVVDVRFSQVLDRIDASESRLRTELHRSLRTNLLATCVFLGGLLTALATL
jgi:hypothetical protein